MANPEAVTREHRQFTDAHGVDIHFYVWRAAKPKAVFQLTHGLGEHALRYEHVAQALAAAGYTVYADDHRGHGATGMQQYDGDAARLGKLGLGGMRATIDNVRHFTALIREESRGLPLVLMGQSWGSLMVQKVIDGNADDYDAAVLTGTAYRTFRHMNSGNFNKLHKHLGSTGNEWLSRDPSVAQAFADDPLTFYANAPKLFGYVDGLRLLGRPTRKMAKNLPLLIMIGAEDSLGGERSVAKLAEAYVRRSKLTDVEAVVYPEARHEIFNETNRDEVIADLVAWLDARIAP